MKKMLVLGLGCFLFFATIAFTNPSLAEEKQDIPTPLIKFDGSNVIFSSNIPSCH